MEPLAGILTGPRSGPDPAHHALRGGWGEDLLGGTCCSARPGEPSWGTRRVFGEPCSTDRP
jgi:hypothetical protein